MDNIKSCKKCSLCQNQAPLLQNNVVHKGVFFVGLSAVKTHNIESDEPFSERTRSGDLLRSISDDLEDKAVYFTNIVKCLPLNNNKIRYPTKLEMESCLDNFKHELDILKPEKIVLFGKKVADYFCRYFDAEKNNNLLDGFSIYSWNNIPLLFSPHPSYILIYKRKQLESYKQSIFTFLEN